MTGALMTYAFTVSLLVAIAALGAEQMVGRLPWPKRVVWISALALSLALPLSIALMTQPVAASNALTPEYQPVAVPGFRPAKTRVDPAAPSAPQIEALAHSDVNIQSVRSRLPSLDRVLRLTWVCLSIGTVLFYALAWVRLSRVAYRCPRLEWDGVMVRQTEHLGPAVFGFLRPEILMPKWLLAAPPAARSMALRHECEHIAARDPLVLMFGIFLVALAPWNPALWWQLGRLRFAIEADCDARVLRDGANVGAYTETLLAVGAHRSWVGSHLMALTTRASWLERRVRLMVSGAGHISRFAAASAAALAVGMMVAAMFLQAPGLAAPAELRKLPPQDTTPAAAAAIAAARSEFPELFNQRFDGAAVVAVLFNRDGSVQRANKHLFPPGQPPSDLDMVLENQPLDIDPAEDIAYAGHESPDFTTGPWLHSENPGRLFIVYEVLKWHHDATRTRQRVQKALAAYDPGLLKSSQTQQTGDTIQLTVFMNEDGSVARDHKRIVHVGESTTEDEVERFAAMGVRREQLGRRGSVTGLTEPFDGSLTIDYAWPRRADDPADVVELNTAWREIFDAHRPKQDDRDDAAILGRYFRQIQERGVQAVTETAAGQRSLQTPWILLGRDGHVWDTGLRHNERAQFQFGMNTVEEIEARYPGIRVFFGSGSSCLPVNGVPIICVWIAADSPIQRKQDVDLQKRKDLLLTSTLLYGAQADSSDPMLRVAPFSTQISRAMNLEVPTDVGLVPNQPWLQVTASPSGPNAVTLLVRTRDILVATTEQPASNDWTPAATLQVSYGSATAVDLFDTTFGAPRKVRLVLRPQRLARL